MNTIKNISDLKNQYQKTQQNLGITSCLTLIQQLNEHYKIDKIIMRQALLKYIDKQQLQSQAQYEKVSKFYLYLVQNQQKIEKEYLEIDQLLPGQNLNYLANKNSISKFLRDQTEHYGQIFNKYCSELNGQQKGLNGSKIHLFLQDLFNTAYTCVLKQKENFLEGQQFYQNIQNTLQNFYLSAKNIDLEQSNYHADTYWLMDHQILDFLQFWTREQSSQQLYVLYARSKRQLQLEINSTNTRNIIIPQKNTSNQQNLITNQNQFLIEIESKIQKKTKAKPQNSQSLLQRYRKKQQSIQQQMQKQTTKKIKSKQQQLLDNSQFLFKFGCKRRYPLPKGTTFDKILQQSQTMNLQKFINLCNYYQINNILNRQLLTQIFKMYAINLRIINLDRFKKILNRMMLTDKKIIQKFLNKSSPQQIKRKNASLSTYKYTLRPVAGKDIEALQQQLSHIKQKKKQKKQQSRKKFQKLVSIDQIKSSKSQSLFPGKTSILELDNIRDLQFHPQFLVDKTEDQLWNAYQAKIWKHSSNNDQLKGLQSVVIKRINQGERVLRKMAQRNLPNYI